MPLQVLPLTLDICAANEYIVVFAPELHLTDGSITSGERTTGVGESGLIVGQWLTMSRWWEMIHPKVDLCLFRNIAPFRTLGLIQTRYTHKSRIRPRHGHAMDDDKRMG